MNENIFLMQKPIFRPEQTQCVPPLLPRFVSEPQRTIHLIGDSVEPRQQEYCQQGSRNIQK